MSNDLVTFLSTCIDEDEVMVEALDECALNGIESTAGLDARDYLVRARADVAAKRLILREFVEADAFCREHRDVPAGEVHGLWTAVRALSVPFANRPGFREEWRVS